MPFSILIVDDDPDVRAAMRRTLREHACKDVSSPREALDVLKTGAFDAIVSDYEMGAERDGLDLLNHVRLLYPDMIRVLVTATRDLTIAVRAVNEGAVHRYFLKPWNEEQLRSSLGIKLAARIKA